MFDAQHLFLNICVIFSELFESTNCGYDKVLPHSYLLVVVKRSQSPTQAHLVSNSILNR